MPLFKPIRRIAGAIKERLEERKSKESKSEHITLFKSPIIGAIDRMRPKIFDGFLKVDTGKYSGLSAEAEDKYREEWYPPSPTFIAKKYHIGEFVYSEPGAIRAPPEKPEESKTDEQRIPPRIERITRRAIGMVMNVRSATPMEEYVYTDPYMYMVLINPLTKDTMLVSGAYLWPVGQRGAKLKWNRMYGVNKYQGSLAWIESETVAGKTVILEDTKSIILPGHSEPEIRHYIETYYPQWSREVEKIEQISRAYTATHIKPIWPTRWTDKLDDPEGMWETVEEEIPPRFRIHFKSPPPPPEVRIVPPPLPIPVRPVPVRLPPKPYISKLPSNKELYDDPTKFVEHLSANIISETGEFISEGAMYEHRYMAREYPDWVEKLKGTLIKLAYEKEGVYYIPIIKGERSFHIEITDFLKEPTPMKPMFRETDTSMTELETKRFWELADKQRRREPFSQAEKDEYARLLRMYMRPLVYGDTSDLYHEKSGSGNPLTKKEREEVDKVGETFQDEIVGHIIEKYRRYKDEKPRPSWMWYEDDKLMLDIDYLISDAWDVITDYKRRVPYKWFTAEQIDYLNDTYIDNQSVADRVYSSARTSPEKSETDMDTMDTDTYLESLVSVDSQVTFKGDFGRFMYEAMVSKAMEQSVDYSENVSGWIDSVTKAGGFPVFITKYAKKRFPEGIVMGRAYRAKGMGKWFKNVPKEDIEKMERAPGDLKWIRVQYGSPSDTHESTDTSPKTTVISTKQTPSYCGECLPGNTLIYGNSSIRAIKDYNPANYGQKYKVISHNGIGRRVTNFFSRQYDGNITTINQYYTNIPLDITPEHPVLCAKNVREPQSKGWQHNGIDEKEIEWVPAKDITTNDFMVFPRIRNVVDVSIVDNNLAELLGWYVSEGCFVQSDRASVVTFSLGHHETDKIDRVVQLITTIFGKKPGITKKGTATRISISSIYWTSIFRQFGDESTEKDIPSWMITLPEEKQYMFLKGYFGGDGCNHNQKWVLITAGTCSQRLAYKMRLILFRLGILHSITYRKPSIGNINGRVIRGNGFYDIKLSGASAVQFISKIGEKQHYNYDIGKHHEYNYGWVGEKYVFLPIKSTGNKKYNGYVYNIHVSGDESYLTIHGAMHNCLAKHFSASKKLMQEAMDRYMVDKSVTPGVREKVQAVVEELEGATHDISITDTTDSQTKAFLEDVLVDIRALRKGIWDAGILSLQGTKEDLEKVLKGNNVLISKLWKHLEKCPKGVCKV